MRRGDAHLGADAQGRLGPAGPRARPVAREARGLSTAPTPCPTTPRPRRDLDSDHGPSTRAPARLAWWTARRRPRGRVPRDGGRGERAGACGDAPPGGRPPATRRSRSRPGRSPGSPRRPWPSRSRLRTSQPSPPEVRTGYGGILLFGATAPSSLGATLRADQAATPQHLGTARHDRRGGRRDPSARQPRRRVPLGAHDGGDHDTDARSPCSRARRHPARRGRGHDGPRAGARRRRARRPARCERP